MRVESLPGRTTGSRRAPLRVALAALGAISFGATSCIITPPSEGQTPRNPEFTLPFDNICLPYEVLTQEDRVSLRRHARVINRILQAEFAPDLHYRINMYQLQNQLDIVKGDIFDPNKKPYLLEQCKALLKSQPADAQGITWDFSYQIKQLEFGVADPWLRAIYGKKFRGEMVIQTTHKRGRFDSFGEPIISRYQVDMVPRYVRQNVPVRELDGLIHRLFAINNGPGTEDTFTVVYPLKSIAYGDTEFHIDVRPMRKSIKFNEPDRTRTLFADQLGRFIVHTSMH